MTAARHRQKALALAILLAVPVFPALAATTELIVTDQTTGLAIGGFDPVAYFTDHSPREGRADLEHSHGGAAWRFCSTGNRAAFVADPEAYMPQFGGYDPTGIARGAPLAGNPQYWLLHGKRLYLFNTPATRDRFVAGAERILTAAAQRWPEIRKTLSP